MPIRPPWWMDGDAALDLVGADESVGFGAVSEALGISVPVGAEAPVEATLAAAALPALLAEELVPDALEVPALWVILN